MTVLMVQLIILCFLWGPALAVDLGRARHRSPVPSRPHHHRHHRRGEGASPACRIRSTGMSSPSLRHQLPLLHLQFPSPPLPHQLDR